MKNKKGFTLIELLAVIIILGILMIIAIPSVTRYINDSRKSSYIDTAKELIGAARNVVNEGNLEMYDTDATYYIDIACLKTENGGKAVSPYGEFVKEKAYVVVTFDGKGYEYFWTSIDESGQGVKNLIRFDKLDTDNIESDLKTDDIKIDRGIDGRSKVALVTERNHCQKEGTIDANGQVNSATGEEKDPVIYPEGKDKSTVTIGDKVTIGTEEFYVVKHDGNKLVLLARYNLKVGGIYNSNNWSLVGQYTESDPGYGLQSSEAIALTSTDLLTRGSVEFATTYYWNDKIGTSEYPGSECFWRNYTPGTTCAYVYNSNSSLYQYIENYKDYLIEHFNMPNTITARLLTFEEAYELGCGHGAGDCNAAPAFVKETSYWLGSVEDNSLIWNISTYGYFGDMIVSTVKEAYGVRPVIVI